MTPTPPLSPKPAPSRPAAVTSLFAHVALDPFRPVWLLYLQLSQDLRNGTAIARIPLPRPKRVTHA